MNFKNSFTIIRIGLALVFLSNGLAAIFAPQELRDLLESSFVSHLFPTSIMLVIIGINDMLVSLLLLSNLKLRLVSIWAMIWLVGVMIVIADFFGILEHLGPFSIALALLINESRTSSRT